MRHQAGDLEKADAVFREAEVMQAERKPEFPLLYSLQGYRYCDLWLGGEGYVEVQRAGGIGRRLNGQRNTSARVWVFSDIALDHLALGPGVPRPGAHRRPGAFCPTGPAQPHPGRSTFSPKPGLILYTRRWNGYAGPDPG